MLDIDARFALGWSEAVNELLKATPTNAATGWCIQMNSSQGMDATTIGSDAA